jgi:5-formyltetrahydrofolate cyclo-ligase
MDALRRKIAELQKNLSADEVKYRSGKAAENLAGWLAQNAPVGALIALYRPLDPNRLGEADPCGVVTDPALAEFHFAFPRVLDRFHKEMDFAVPIHPSDWVNGIYGNAEPRPELPAADPHEFDVIVVPGVVFGALGERIGRGAGFYDRYLMRASGALRIGYGFDFQLLKDPVPQEDWDARMDVVITDHRTIETFARPSV